jgi:DNA-binding winged helix-turn-helix (wHTH) protein
VGREHGSFRFGGWIVEPQLNRVSRDGLARNVPPKAMDVLAALLVHPAQVLSVDDLIALAWNGRPVEESSVHHRISQIRKVLGDERHLPIYIENVSRRGYRTVAEVEPLDPDSTKRSQVHAASPYASCAT